MTPAERQACLIMLHMFKIDGKPADECASEGQIEIFFNLVFRPSTRLQILCSTQYGKSLFVALACIIITCCQHEVVAVLAPTDEKARIIMRYYIDHLGDDPSFQTELEKNTKLDRLRMEESKERIMLKHGGGIFILSVQAGNTKKGVEAAMGAGSKIVIQDESGLIPDQIESTVFRMIAGKGEDAFYCKIGNPFYRNHFLTSWNDPAYAKVFIDYARGLEEGRYQVPFIEEARKKPLFDVLYGCIFPGEGMMDTTGYLMLIQKSRITTTPSIPALFKIGRKILGIDPSGEGKDKATFVLRNRFRAEKIHEMKTANPREIAERALTFIAEYEIDPYDVVVDSFGVGSDVGKEIALATAQQGGYEVYTVLLGNKPIAEEEYNRRFFYRHDNEKGDNDVDLYLNLRALMYFRAQGWLYQGGQIVDPDGLFTSELTVQRYKRSLQGNTIQLMPKLDMFKLGIASPNVADGFALTFLRDIADGQQSPEERERILAEENDIDPSEMHNAL